jgi:transposase-like protein
MDTNENNTQGRASYTEEERRELIEEFHASGIKQAAFCREWNINPKTLARWLRLERQEKEVSFCEVELPVNDSRGDELRIYLPNGVKVALHVASSTDLGGILREAAGCLD